MSMPGPDVPVGWCWVQLGDLLEAIEAGKSPKAHGRPAVGEEYGVLKVSAVTWGRFNPDENKAMMPGQIPNPADLVRKGDFLISRANTVELVGAVVLVDEEHPRLMLCDKTLRLNTHSDLIRKEYLLHALRSSWVREIFEDKATGTSDSMRNLSQDKIRSAPILLPPITEQSRLVAKIDALQARSRRAREALNAIPALLERFRQSVLAAAFRGDLTADWRAKHPDVEPASVLLERIRAERKARWIAANPKKAGKYVEPEPVDPEKEGLPELPAGWCWASVEEVTERLSYGTAKKSQSSGEVAVLRMGNLQNGEIDWGDLAYTDDLEDIDKYLLPPGAVLFNRTNSPPLVGKTAIVRGERRAIYAGYLIRIHELRGISPAYINWILNSPQARAWCSDVKSDGVSQSNISGSKLATFRLPMCPESEQQEIVRLAEAFLAVEGRVQEKQEMLRGHIQTLDQSILAKAFRGELVPQDPTDEPASVLLDRIKTERAAQPTKSRSRRPPR